MHASEFHTPMQSRHMPVHARMQQKRQQRQQRQGSEGAPSSFTLSSSSSSSSSSSARGAPPSASSTEDAAANVLRDLDEALQTRLESDWAFLPGVPTAEAKAIQRSSTGSRRGVSVSRDLKSRWTYVDVDAQSALVEAGDQNGDDGGGGDGEVVQAKSRVGKKGHSSAHMDKNGRVADTGGGSGGGGQSSASAEQWVGLEFELKLENVHLKLYDTRRCDEERQQQRGRSHARVSSLDSDAGAGGGQAGLPAGMRTEDPLAHVHLLQSALSFVAYENHTLDDLGVTVRLYSTAIAVDNMLPDTDAAKPNLYRRMLAPIVDSGASRARAPSAAGAGVQLSEGMGADIEGTDQDDNGSGGNSGRGGKERAPQLEVTFTMKPQADMLHVLLNRTRVHISPEWALRMAEFATGRAESGLKQLHTERKHFLQEKYMDIKAPPRETPQHTRVTLNITHPELVLVDDVTSPTSEALVMKVCNVTKLTLNQYPDMEPKNPAHPVLLEHQELETYMEVSE